MSSVSLRRWRMLVVSSFCVCLVSLTTALLLSHPASAGPQRNYGHSQEDTTTIPPSTTTSDPLPTTTSTTTPPDAPLQACFIAGQDGDAPPDATDVSCSTAWTSGRQTRSFLDHDAEQEDRYRKPFLFASGVVIFLLSVHVVGRWRR